MEKVQRYLVAPSTHLFFGREVTKDLKFHEFTDDKIVEQTMENCVMTTKVKRTYEINGIKTTETTKLVQEIPEGKILAWSEEVGYVVPEQRMITAEEAIEGLKPLVEFSNKEE